jgi:hypothetical protein
MIGVCDISTLGFYSFIEIDASIVMFIEGSLEFDMLQECQWLREKMFAKIGKKVLVNPNPKIVDDNIKLWVFSFQASVGVWIVIPWKQGLFVILWIVIQSQCGFLDVLFQYSMRSKACH